MRAEKNATRVPVVDTAQERNITPLKLHCDFRHNKNNKLYTRSFPDIESSIAYTAKRLSTQRAYKMRGLSIPNRRLAQLRTFLANLKRENGIGAQLIAGKQDTLETIASGTMGQAIYSLVVILPGFPQND